MKIPIKTSACCHLLFATCSQIVERINCWTSEIQTGWIEIILPVSTSHSPLGTHIPYFDSNRFVDTTNRTTASYISILLLILDLVNFLPFFFTSLFPVLSIGATACHRNGNKMLIAVKLLSLLKKGSMSINAFLNFLRCWLKTWHSIK